MNEEKKADLFKRFNQTVLMNSGLDFLGIELEEVFENKRTYRKFMKHIGKASREFYKALVVSGHELDKLCPKGE